MVRKRLSFFIGCLCFLSSIGFNLSQSFSSIQIFSNNKDLFCSHIQNIARSNPMNLVTIKVECSNLKNEYQQVADSFINDFSKYSWSNGETYSENKMYFSVSSEDAFSLNGNKSSIITMENLKNWRKNYFNLSILTKHLMYIYYDNEASICIGKEMADRLITIYPEFDSYDSLLGHSFEAVTNKGISFPFYVSAVYDTSDPNFEFYKNMFGKEIVFIHKAGLSRFSEPSINFEMKPNFDNIKKVIEFVDTTALNKIELLSVTNEKKPISEDSSIAIEALVSRPNSFFIYFSAFLLIILSIFFYSLGFFLIKSFFLSISLNKLSYIILYIFGIMPSIISVAFLRTISLLINGVSVYAFCPQTYFPILIILLLSLLIVTITFFCKWTRCTYEKN